MAEYDWLVVIEIHKRLGKKKLKKKKKKRGRRRKKEKKKYRTNQCVKCWHRCHCSGGKQMVMVHKNCFCCSDQAFFLHGSQVR